MPGWCSVSVDLDPLDCYYMIHDLGTPPRALAEVVLERALPRFGEVFARRGISATLFVVGRDLERHEAGRERLAALARAGHELGNHSFGHRYDLGRLGVEEVREDIGRAHRLIAQVAERPPVGFRAPGYDLSRAMAQVLGELGYLYDSSLLPALPYWSAKAVVMGLMRLTGRRSGAVLTDPRGLFAPRHPYRVDPRAPWRTGQGPFVELPMAVTRHLRLPLIGTSLLTAPVWLRARWLEEVRARSFFDFELHGIDLIDAEHDGIPAALVARQPDLRVPLRDKLRAFEATLDRLAPDFAFVPLREVASEVQREGRL